MGLLLILGHENQPINDLVRCHNPLGRVGLAAKVWSVTASLFIILERLANPIARIVTFSTCNEGSSPCLVLSSTVAWSFTAVSYLKVRAINGESGGHPPALELSSAGTHLTHGRRSSASVGCGGEDSTEPSSGCKGFSPGDPTSGNHISATPFEFGPDVGGRDLTLNSSTAHSGGHFHPSGSSGGSRTATGYANPVPDIDIGLNGGTANESRPISVQPPANNSSNSPNLDGNIQSNGNTYGPLTAITGASRDRFPPIHPYYDDFEHRLHCGVGGRCGICRQDRESGVEVKRDDGPPGEDFGDHHNHAVGRGVYSGFEDRRVEEGAKRRPLRLGAAESTRCAFRASTEPETHEIQRPGMGNGYPPIGAPGVVISPSDSGTGLSLRSCDSRRQLLGASPSTQLTGASPATQIMGDSPSTTQLSGASPATQLSGASPSTQLLGPSPPTSDFTPSIPPGALEDEGIAIAGRMDGKISGLTAKLRRSRSGGNW